MIFFPTFLALMHLLITETYMIIGKTLHDILNELNERLIISTNIIFCKQFDNLIHFEAQTSRFVYSSLEAFNITSLWNHVGNDNKLFVIVGNVPPYELFAKLELSSPENCTQFILNNTVDMCADALVKNSKAFSVSRELRIAPANVIVPHGKPLLSYRYLAAPFNTKVWIALGTYVFLISGFLCLIHWLRSGKWDFSQNLLEVYSSLLFTGFHLKATNGIERYILFGVLFISGFVYSTSYLRLLKSMLIAETFEKQIQTFEELAESNIPLLINPYDRMIFQHHHIPKSLWTAVRTVSSETLLNHRSHGYVRLCPAILTASKIPSHTHRHLFYICRISHEQEVVPQGSS